MLIVNENENDDKIVIIKIVEYRFVWLGCCLDIPIFGSLRFEQMPNKCVVVVFVVGLECCYRMMVDKT